MDYFTALHIFITSVLFKNTDLNYKSKLFNPVKAIVFVAIVTNIWLTIYLFSILVKVRNKILLVCPQFYS